MFRFDGEVFRFGTAMAKPFLKKKRPDWRAKEPPS
jgi:hypothetical protein